MSTVYLTSGPRGSGKSTYVNEVASHNPKITVVSRDDILVKLFGKTSLNPYTGGHDQAIRTCFQKVKECLTSNTDVILDYWNGFPGEREHIIKKLKDLGADRVFCWCFVVPAETCVQWFMSKPDSRGYSEFGARQDHRLYYREAKEIEEDGFDEVCYIDPRQLLLFPPLLQP